MRTRTIHVAASSPVACLVIFAACGGAGWEGNDALRDGGESIDAREEPHRLVDAALALEAGGHDASRPIDASDGGDAANVTDAPEEASFDAAVDGDAAADAGPDAGADAGPDAGALAWFYSTPLTVSNESSSGLYVFAWNANTASLLEIDMDPSTPGTQGVIGGAGMLSIAAAPSGKFLYTANATDSTIGAYAVEAATGWLSRIDADPAAGIQDQASAATGPIFVAVHPTADVLYVALGYAGALETLAIDPTSGALTHASTIAVGSAPAAIALDPFGRYLAVANSAGDSVTLCRLDASGLPTAIDADATVNGRQDFDTGAAPSALTFDRAGTHLHVAHANGVASYLVDALTVSLFGARRHHAHGIAVRRYGAPDRGFPLRGDVRGEPARAVLDRIKHASCARGRRLGARCSCSRLRAGRQVLVCKLGRQADFCVRDRPCHRRFDVAKGHRDLARRREQHVRVRAPLKHGDDGPARARILRARTSRCRSGSPSQR